MNFNKAIDLRKLTSGNLVMSIKVLKFYFIQVIPRYFCIDFKIL